MDAASDTIELDRSLVTKSFKDLRIYLAGYRKQEEEGREVKLSIREERYLGFRFGNDLSS